MLNFHFFTTLRAGVKLPGFNGKIITTGCNNEKKYDQKEQFMSCWDRSLSKVNSHPFRVFFKDNCIRNAFSKKTFLNKARRLCQVTDCILS